MGNVTTKTNRTKTLNSISGNMKFDKDSLFFIIFLKIISNKENDMRQSKKFTIISFTS